MRQAGVALAGAAAERLGAVAGALHQALDPLATGEPGILLGSLTGREPAREGRRHVKEPHAWIAA